VSVLNRRGGGFSGSSTSAVFAAWGDWRGLFFVRAAGSALRAGSMPTPSTGPPTPLAAGQSGSGHLSAPHLLRRKGINCALDLANGDVRKVQRFSRHAKVENLLRYDDNRRAETGALDHLLNEKTACRSARGNARRNVMAVLIHTKARIGAVAGRYRPDIRHI
jgi:hypothetical protein